MPFIPKILSMAGATALLVACSVPNGAVQNSGPVPPMIAPVMEMPAALAEASPARIALDSPVIIAPPPISTISADAQAGVLTAGDIDDALNLAPFLRYQRAASQALGLPGASLDRPVLAQLRGPSGAPAPGVRVTFREPGAVDPFYDGYSGVDGMISVFPAALGQTRLRTVEMRTFVQGADTVLQTRLATGDTRHAVTLPTESTWSPDFLDLVFVVDTTGSMGDELAWLSAEIRQITGAVQQVTPDVDIRMGLVVYKAPADPYVVKSYGFTKNAAQFARWVASERSSGGAGGPEVVADALHAAVQMDWRRGKGERLIFQIGDEPPLAQKTETYYRAAQTAAQNGVQVFSLAASGVEAQLEFLMRQGAVMTGGRYLFLTDDSGVGLGHAEPTISCYQVTPLSDLMVRVLRSELGGTRVEAPGPDVIREVGSYQNGRCRD